MKGFGFAVFLLAFALCLAPPIGLAVSNEGSIILVYCRDDSTTPQFRDMVHFAHDLAKAIGDGLGENRTEVVACTSLSELNAYLLLPRVVAVVSSYVGSSEVSTSFPFSRVFSEGMGLVGMNHLCSSTYSGELASSVFPIFGNSSSKGSMRRVNGRWIRTRTYNLSSSHPISSGLPDGFIIPDYQMTFCKRSDRRYGDGWPEPAEGKYVVVFETRGRESPYPGKALPGIVAYENEGRSVCLPGFYGSELPGVTNYANFVNDTTFTKLLANCVKWVSESGMARKDRLSASFQEKLQGLKDEIADQNSIVDSWASARSSRKLLFQMLVMAGGFVSTGVVLFLGFKGNGRDVK